MSTPFASPGMRRCTLALVAGLLAALLGWLGLAAPLDDAFHRAIASPRPSPTTPQALVLGIDRTDPWPWPNGRIADLLERLRNAGARGVALDLPISTGPASDPAGDARLARSLLDHRIVLGVVLLPQADGPPRARLPPIEFADAARLGHVLLPRDRDGRIRQHLPHRLAADGVRWPSLPLALVQPGNANHSGGWEAQDRWRIRYADDAASAPTLRAADVMAGRIDASQLQGRWVLVGLTDPSLQARLPGPFGSASLYPVEHEARALGALLQGDTPRPVPPAMQVLLALLLAGGAVFAGMARGGRDWRLPIAACVGLVAALSLSGWLLGRQLWFAPGGTVAVLGAALLVWGASALRQRARLRRPMPGLATRGHLDAALHAARTAGTPHALLLIETAGDAPRSREHGAADTCRLAQLLRERARRPGDVAAHLGAGRFALFLPATPATAAERILEEIRGQAAGVDLSPPPEGRVHACTGEACSCPGQLGMSAAGTAHPSR